MVSKTYSPTYTIPPLEAARQGNLEAIALLLQQTLMGETPQFLPEAMVKTALEALGEEQDAEFYLSAGAYEGVWTSSGMVLTPQASTAPHRWRKRTTPLAPCPPLTRLLNRQVSVKAAIATLQAGGMVEVSGNGGRGKTALLRALAHHPQLSARFPGGIVYQRGYDRPVEDLWQGSFEALYESADADSSAALTHAHKPSPADIQHYLARQHICVMWDELSAAPSAHNAEQVAAIPLVVSVATPTSGTDGLRQGRRLKLKGLPENDAIVLFEEGMGRSLLEAEKPPAQIICQRLDGHPLWILQYAALVRQRDRTLTDLAQSLQGGTPAATPLIQAITHLSENERDVLKLLASLGHTPLHAAHFSTLTDHSNHPQHTIQCLEGLAAKQFVWTDGTYYRLATNLIEPLQSTWDMEPWIAQLTTYFQAWLKQISQPSRRLLAQPIHDNADALWTVLRYAFQRQQWSTVLAMGGWMEKGLWQSQRWGRWQQVLLLQWMAARSLRNKAAEATILHQLGSRATYLGDRTMAQLCFIRAFHYRRELGDIQGAAITQHNLTGLAPLAASVSSENGDTVDAEPVVGVGAPAVGAGAASTAAPVLPGAVPADAAATAAPPSADDTAILKTPSWISWPKLAMAVGAIAALGTGIVLFQNRSFEYGLRPKYTFPPQRTQISSEWLTIPITNTSNGNLPIDIAFQEGDREDFQLDPDACTEQPLAPGETCTLTASFVPQADGPRSATFAVGFGSEEEARTLTFQGIGADVKAEFNPNALTFGQQVQGDRSTTQTITFRNRGTLQFTVSDVAVEQGDETVFTVEKDHCSNQTLLPRDSCSIDLVFAPTAAVPYEATIALVDETDQKTWNVALSGMGIAPQIVTRPAAAPPPTGSWRPALPRRAPAPRPPAVSTPQPRVMPALTASQSSVSFEGQLTNTASTRTLEIRNGGTAPARINDVLLTEGNGFQLNGQGCLGQTLAPDSRCSVEITFTPPAATTYTDTLTVQERTTGRTVSVPLRGTGIEPEVAPRPVINGFTATPPSGLQPTESTTLCYDVANATAVRIVDGGGQSFGSWSSPSDCLPVSPGRTTAYTLVATNRDGETVQQSLTVSVIEPDSTPPPTPRAIFPSPSSPVYCTEPVALQWGAVEDAGGPVSYRVMLQQQGVSSSSTILDQTVSQASISVSSLVQPPLTYQWQVQAIDAAGNTSASGWLPFWCIAP